ncbi:MAG: hypothetical protein EAZ61_06165 [Oscillatoriales cyanobacterium]|nr:MAG: hypothetical protein EAZ61_06165 [Oscillatoriales cyanobacterium]
MIDPTIFTDEPNNVALDAGISLREAIDLTPDGETITLQAGTYYIAATSEGSAGDDSNQRGDFDIVGKTLTIRGAGENLTVIDAQTVDRVWHILKGATLILEGVTVRNGGNVSEGGGILNEGTLELSQSSLSGNESAGGEGGVGGGLYNQGTATLTQATVSSNRSTVSGGGIANVGGSLVLVETTVSGNTTTIEGGGIANRLGYSTYSSEGSSYTPGVVQIINSTISGNQVHSDTQYPRGGGLLNGTDSSMSLVNSTVSGNTLSVVGLKPSYGDRSGGGAALYAQHNSYTALTHATIAHNTSSIGSGGVFLQSYGESRYYTRLVLTNSIISGNSDTDLARAGSDDAQVTIRGTNIVSVADSSIDGNILTVDPQLAPLANNGGATQTHALLEGSPAIDTASRSVAAATDQRGLERDTLPDIGAWERLEIITILESAQSTKVLEGFGGIPINPNDPEARENIGDFYRVTLNYEPSAEVTVDLAFDLEQVTLASATLTFTPENWDISQVVFVGAIDDDQDMDPRSSTIAHSSLSDDPLFFIEDVGHVTVDIVDNDGNNGEVLTLFDRVKFGSDHNDIYAGFDEVNEIHGKDGIDLIFGYGGNDRLFGGGGGDGLSGGDGIDYVNGEAGDDFLSGGEGDDIMYGSLGRDIMSGDGGNDLIFGGDGDDELWGGSGDDTLVGGLGRDVFILDAQGSTLIVDYQPFTDALSLLITDPIDSLNVSVSRDSTTTFTNLIDRNGTILASLANVAISSLDGLTIL